MPLSIDLIDDETSYMNVGQQDEYHYMHLHLEVNEKTSWISYPEKYKFFSTHVYLNPDVRTTERSTYDLLDCVSDVGGIIEVVVAFFGIITAQYSRLKLKAVLTNRLFLLTAGVQKNQGKFS